MEAKISNETADRIVKWMKIWEDITQELAELEGQLSFLIKPKPLNMNDLVTDEKTEPTCELNSKLAAILNKLKLLRMNLDI